jgi:hypothetical protein
MPNTRYPYLLLLSLAAGCAASTRVEDFEVRQHFIYSGGGEPLVSEPAGDTLGSVRSGDTLQVVASIVNEETGELLYYLVDRDGSRARVRAPLLRRDPSPPIARVDTLWGTDTLARAIFTDGKGLRYYIDGEGNKVYVREPEKPVKAKSRPKGKGSKKKKKK